MPGCTQARETLPAKDGGIEILGFMVWAIFKIDFFGFCTKKLLFLGFGACYRLQFLLYFAPSFRFFYSSNSL